MPFECSGLASLTPHRDLAFERPHFLVCQSMPQIAFGIAEHLAIEADNDALALEINLVERVAASFAGPCFGHNVSIYRPQRRRVSHILL